jgi:AcrR family transcriptional regulator
MMNSKIVSSQETPKTRILRVAQHLFYQNGIRATGIDRIIADSVVAKRTFYRAFPSKEALILAFLEYRHEHWMKWFQTALEQAGAKPGAGIKPLLIAMKTWFSSPTLLVCSRKYDLIR